MPIATTSVPSGSSRPTAGTSVCSRRRGHRPSKGQARLEAGSAGGRRRSMRCAMPSSVTTATCEASRRRQRCTRQRPTPRAVRARGSPPSTRASPEEDKTTTHGSSGIYRSRPLPERDTDGRAASAASSAAAAAPTGVPVEASSSVRRGVPRRSETSRSSSSRARAAARLRILQDLAQRGDCRHQLVALGLQLDA